MNKIEEMKNSCAVFAADLKTGGVVWSNPYPETSMQFNYIVDFIGVIIWLNEDDIAFCVEVPKNRTWVTRKLKSTTAKEAAHEALQLVKQEAQKLVDALTFQNIPNHEKAEK